MANKTVTLQPILRANEATEFTSTAFSANDTVKIPMDDKNVVVFISASAAGNVVFEAGEGIGASNDLTVACSEGIGAIQLDSSSFEKLEGDNAGYCIMKPAIAGTVNAISTL